MLLARLLGWIKTHKTTNIFMLEIAAVFIGITGSLFVDNWRQQQVDYEKLDRELRTLHYELSKGMSNDNVEISWTGSALRSTVLLAFGDLESLTDDELLDHFWRATLFRGYPQLVRKLQANNSTLSIPFNETVAIIEAELQNLDVATEEYRQVLETGSTQGIEIVRMSKLVADVGGFGSLKDQDLVEEELELGRLTTGADGEEFVGHQYNRSIIREVVGDPEIKERLRQLIPVRRWTGNAHLMVLQFQRNVIAAIDTYAPDITVPFKEVGIDGSATLYGWQTYLPMTQDDENPDLWRITLELVDGEVKFRADNAWAVNWGTTEVDSSFACDETITDDCSGWGFQGDMSRAFPTGKVQLDGSNIPVRAGRYDITFNTETLEYSFEQVDIGE